MLNGYGGSERLRGVRVVGGKGDVVGGMPVPGQEFEGEGEAEQVIYMRDDVAAIRHREGAILRIL